MGIDKLFGGNFPLVEKSLSLRARRHELIVSNIANADTPNYKSFDIVIDEEIQKTGDSTSGTPLAATHPNHLRTARTGFDQVTIHTKKSDGLSLRGDGNTVDMDAEMVNLSENSLLYRASSQIMKKMFGALRTAMNTGK